MAASTDGRPAGEVGGGPHQGAAGVDRGVISRCRGASGSSGPAAVRPAAVQGRGLAGGLVVEHIERHLNARSRNVPGDVSCAGNDLFGVEPRSARVLQPPVFNAYPGTAERSLSLETTVQLPSVMAMAATIMSTTPRTASLHTLRRLSASRRKPSYFRGCGLRVRLPPCPFRISCFQRLHLVHGRQSLADFLR